MSNNFTCRDKYYNYGSYLRSRGYDKEICNLVSAIEHGDIPIGPITPGNCGVSATVIQGDVIIIPCPSDLSSGILRVNGGSIGGGNINNLLSESLNYGVQTLNGLKVTGPIFQTTDCSHSNYFAAGNHIFAGGNMGMDCSTNVIIEGNLDVYGDISINHLTVYDLSVINVLTVGTTTTTITTDKITGNHLQINDISCSGNIEITGSGVFIGDLSSTQLVDLSNAISSNTINISNNMAHIADISNIISNYDISFTTVDMTVTNNLDVSSIEISNNLLIGGDIIGTTGDLLIGGFSGNVSIVAGTPPVYGNDIVLKASNIDFSGSAVNFTDISDNVTFNKNPVINNGNVYENRVLYNYGQTTTILDISVNKTTGYYDDNFYDLSYGQIIYTDLDVSAQMAFQPGFIDFSNNQPYFTNSIMEVYLSSTLEFDTNNTDSVTFSFHNTNLASPLVVPLDTRTIRDKNISKTICFGPQMFVFKENDYNTDISFVYEQWSIALDVSGGPITFNNNPRIVIKQKSIV